MSLKLGKFVEVRRSLFGNAASSYKCRKQEAKNALEETALAHQVTLTVIIFPNYSEGIAKKPGFCFCALLKSVGENYTDIHHVWGVLNAKVNMLARRYEITRQLGGGGFAITFLAIVSGVFWACA